MLQWIPRTAIAFLENRPFVPSAPMENTQLIDLGFGIAATAIVGFGLFLLFQGLLEFNKKK